LRFVWKVVLIVFCQHIYYRHGLPSIFEELLDHLQQESFFTAIDNDKQLPCLFSLAAYYTQQAFGTTESSEQKAFMTKATSLYNQCDKISLKEHHVWIGKGLWLNSSFNSFVAI
jgi:hypothetical protein